MKSLRLKILGSFLLLILMLALAGGVSIYQLNWLSNSVHGLLEDNYKSVKATKAMIEALEREDSGVLLFLLGEPNEGKAILKRADSTFQEAFRIAENNQTEENEEQYIKTIQKNYDRYRSTWQHLEMSQDSLQNIVWYKNNIHDSFKETKRAVEELMMLNQNMMYESSSAIEEKARRAIMPGIISIVGAIVFSMILNFYINRHFVLPLNRLKEAIQDTRKEDHHLPASLQLPGELNRLKNAINQMIQRFHQHN